MKHYRLILQLLIFIAIIVGVDSSSDTASSSNNVPDDDDHVDDHIVVVEDYHSSTHQHAARVPPEEGKYHNGQEKLNSLINDDGKNIHPLKGGGDIDDDIGDDKPILSEEDNESLNPKLYYQSSKSASETIQQVISESTTINVESNSAATAGQWGTAAAATATANASDNNNVHSTTTSTHSSMNSLNDDNHNNINSINSNNEMNTHQQHQQQKQNQPPQHIPFVPNNNNNNKNSNHNNDLIINSNQGTMNSNKTNTANLRILHRKDNMIKGGGGGSGSTISNGNHDDEHHIELIRYNPPDSFTLTAKITSSSEFLIVDNDDNDDNDDDNQKSDETTSTSASTTKLQLPSIPFIECNNIGTTTPPIPSHATFRHFAKSGAHPTTYTKTHGLIIPLSPIEIQTKHHYHDKKANSSSGNNKNVKVFDRGDVIWVDGGEYMMTAANGSDDDLSVLILNIDPKVMMSHKGRRRSGGGGGNDIFVTKNYISNGGSSSSSSSSRNCFLGGNNDETTLDDFENSLIESISNIPIRRMILSSIGLSLSSMFAYFLSKVAPLQLAVGVGGFCIIAGGTYASILGGEWLCDELEKKIEERNQDLEVEEEEVNTIEETRINQHFEADEETYT